MAAVIAGNLADALRAVALAREIEVLSEGYPGMPPGQRREKRGALFRATDDRILEALRAGATSAEMARALGMSANTARSRTARVKREAGDDPEGVVSLRQPAPDPAPPGAPSIWREVPMCARPAPPPWPVSRRCARDQGHEGEHDYSRGR